MSLGDKMRGSLKNVIKRSPKKRRAKMTNIKIAKSPKIQPLEKSAVSKSRLNRVVSRARRDVI